MGRRAGWSPKVLNSCTARLRGHADDVLLMMFWRVPVRDFDPAILSLTIE